MIKDQFCFPFTSQVLEYHPKPWNQWEPVAYLEKETGTLLRCLSDEGNHQFMMSWILSHNNDSQRFFSFQCLYYKL